MIVRLLVVAACLAAMSGPARAQSACTTDAQCADGNACNGLERCLGGFCAPGTPPSCNDGNVCTLDQCDPVAGCQHAPVVNGTSCSDGNPCNGPEVCKTGLCTQGTAPADGTSCNTGNPCTNGDHCQAGTCLAGPPRADGSGCSDGNPCNGRELCQQGQCTAGTPVADGTSCGDGDPCNGIDTCKTGLCLTGAATPEGASCSDGDACNGLETCHQGACVVGTTAADGTPCPDADLCDGTETCKDGICRAGTTLNCDDGNPCTNDSCGAAVGCKHVERAAGSFCDDGVVCNGRERCQAGAVCTPGPVAADGTLCEDGDDCNGVETCRAGACSAGTPAPDGTSCSDGDACNGAEVCHAKACTPGTPLTCADDNPCTADTCSALLGCRFPALPNGAACGDGDVCNGADTCDQGSCVTGPAPVCSDGDPATPDVCDPLAGCTVDDPIPGDKLKVAAAGKRGTALAVRAKDAIPMDTPPADGSSRDPVLHGAVLRVRSVAAGFDVRVPLPATGWAYLGAPGDQRGWRWRATERNAPIRSVVVRGGRALKLNGAGLVLGPPLAGDPRPVEVVLILGDTRYCMQFGGNTDFVAGKRFSASAAPAPAACPP